MSYINTVQKIDTNKYYVKWDSSDKKIATVKENGEIIAQKAGYVEIIAKIMKKSNNVLVATKKCYVHVVNTKIVKYTSNGKNKLKMQLNSKNIVTVSTSKNTIPIGTLKNISKQSGIIFK